MFGPGSGSGGGGGPGGVVIKGGAGAGGAGVAGSEGGFLQEDDEQAGAGGRGTSTILPCCETVDNWSKLAPSHDEAQFRKSLAAARERMGLSERVGSGFYDAWEDLDDGVKPTKEGGGGEGGKGWGWELVQNSQHQVGFEGGVRGKDGGAFVFA